MTAQWPLLAARLVTLLPTLPAWVAARVKVYDGAAFDVPSTVATFATVGHATDGMTTTAGSYTTTLAQDGVRYVEQGSVVCQLTTSVSAGITAPRVLVLDLMNDIQAEIRADRTLGVLSAEGTVDLRVDVTSTQAIPGASVTTAFSLDYFTVT